MINAIYGHDFEKIKELHSQQSSHELNFDRVLYHALVKKHGQLVAYGAIKRLNELVITVDKTESIRARGDAISNLLDHAIKASQIDNLGDLVTFADEKFAKLLIRHFGFSEIEEKPLILKVKNG